jgi:tetratricopeptide (TPR) repeat protein
MAPLRCGIGFIARGVPPNAYESRPPTPEPPWPGPVKSMPPSLARLLPVLGVLWTSSLCHSVTDDPILAGSGDPYAGSASCRDCHEQFHTLWSTSHHGRAMQPFTAELARHELTAQPEPIAVGPYRFHAEPDKALLREVGPDGEKTYAMLHAVGGKNVFYFLTPLERGRLQVLPLAYDVNRKEWFDTTLSAMRHFGDAPDSPLFWKEPPYTFNTSCYNCHVSQLEKNYNPQTDSYQTRWGEPGINCETCHGPGAEHVRAARLLPPGAPMPDPKLIVAGTMTPDQMNAMCGSCHAKLTVLTGAFTPGERFYDHFGMATLEDRDFYPDGRDLGENFTMTTWGLSPCLKSGQLDCVHCHTSSGRYRFRTGEANAACLPCHEVRVKTVTEHSRHPADSTASRCISCHMPMTEFARMRRSDHSMRPPAPAATIAFGSPNACNLCHVKETPAWANEHVRKWRTRDYQAPLLHRGALIAAARAGDWSKLPAIVAYLTSPDREEIWSASLLQLLRSCREPAKWAAVAACLQDHSPLVRSAAVDAIGDELRPESVQALLRATRDEYRLVRVHAAAALSGLTNQPLPEADRRSLRAATDEYLASLKVRPDDSMSRYNLGNFHLSRGEFAIAVDEFTAASRFQPQSLPPLANRALAYAALGQNDKAEASLRQALTLAPADPGVNLNLGMLLAEMGRLAESEQAFRTCFKSDPQSAAAAYNLGVMLSRDRPDESLQWCRRAAALRPEEPRYAYTLGYFLAVRGRHDEAIHVLEGLIQRQPGAGDAYHLLASLYQRLNRPADALRIYRAGAANPALPPEERLRFQLRRP